MNEDSILFDDNEYYVLSNFSAFNVEWREKLWPTSEQAYQAAKFKNIELQERIRNAKSPIDAYTIAHDNKSEMDPSFSKRKLEIMEEILRAKVTQHTYIRLKLKESGNRDIVKNFKGDNYWGTGPDGKGENQLGKLWMKIREKINEGEL